MTTLPRATISPSVSPSRGTSRPSASTTRRSPEVMSSTPCRALSSRALGGRQRFIFGTFFTDGDERRRLGQAVDLRDRPAQPLLDVANRRRSGRRSGRDHADAARDLAARRGIGVREADEHGRRRAQHLDALVANQREHLRRLDLAEAHVRATDGRDDPRERPAVGVEHRQRPQIAVADPHRQVQQRPDGVEVGVAVRDHHALGLRRRAARVVDGQQIAFVDRGAIRHRRRIGDQPLVFQPPLVRSLRARRIACPPAADRGCDRRPESDRGARTRPLSRCA